jgi:hypothetical protein
MGYPLGLHLSRLGVLCAFAAVPALLAGVSPAAGAGAHAARTYSLNETAHLHRTSGRGITINQDLNEEGSASGTISGTIYIHLRVVSTNRVTAEVNIYPSDGSITGSASASYRSAGAVATFTGTMRIERGTGRYAHASGSGLSFTGTIQRINDAAVVHVTGRMFT